MKAYLITTGVIFGLLTVMHVCGCFLRPVFMAIAIRGSSASR